MPRALQVLLMRQHGHPPCGIRDRLAGLNYVALIIDQSEPEWASVQSLRSQAGMRHGADGGGLERIG